MRVLEVFLVHSGDTGGAEEVVASGDDVVCVCDAHGGFDFTHDGVERGVGAEGFADDVVEEGAFGEFLVYEGGGVLSKDALLFGVEVLDELGLFSDVQEHPGDCSH